MGLLLNRASITLHQAGFVALDDLRTPWVERFMLHADQTIPVDDISPDALQHLQMGIINMHY